MEKKPKSKAKPLGATSMTMKDWQNLHPIEFSEYSSDIYYFKIANKIVRLLEGKGLRESYSKDDLQFAALRLAAYFEDVVSELCVFRAFLNIYRVQYRNPFPWYQVKEEYLDDEVNLVDVQFVLWYCLLIRCDNSVPYPEDVKILNGARAVYDLFLEEFEKAPVNEQLVDDVFADRIMDDAEEIKVVFRWITSKSYLSMVPFPARNERKPIFDELHKVFSGLCTDTVDKEYVDSRYKAFGCTCGPLAISPQYWYDQMLMAKNRYYGMENLSQIEVTPFYPFVITWESEKVFFLCSCRGHEYRVLKTSFLEPELNLLGEGCIVETKLFYYKGAWHSFGVNRITQRDEVDEGFDELELMNKHLVKKNGTKVDMVGKTDEEIPGNSPYGRAYEPLKCARALNNNQSNRLFYFKDSSAAQKWIEKNLTGKKTTTTDLPETDRPIALYLRTDFTIVSTTAVEVIRDRRNPYYVKYSEKELFKAILQPELIPNTILYYMVFSGFTDRLTFESDKDSEHARKLMQDNLRFFLTMMRQYNFQ